MKAPLNFNSGVMLSLLLLVIIPSCGDNFGSGEGVNFDREALLENLGSNIIIPSYNDYQEGVTALKQRSIEFTQVPNSQTLQTLRDQFRSSYLLWQRCSFYEFGPASEVKLKASTNSFPANIQNIEANINSGVYDLNSPSNLSSIGFPAIDFLIHGNNKTNNEIIIEFVDNATKRNYLNDIVVQMENKINEVVDGWSPNGSNYLEGFIVRSGTESASSISLLMNAYIKHLDEDTKNAKIGIPLGILSGGVLPEKVEAYYSHQSVPYISENTQAMKNLFSGNFNGNTGIGFDDWLTALGSRFEDKLLTNAITDQFDSCLMSISEISDPLSNSVTEQPQQPSEAYSELELLTELFKTQVATALGITITD